MADFEKLVGVLKAAGEVTRLRLLALLADGELTVKDLTDILGQSQPRVSRHLKLLGESGLVKRNAEGAWAFFRVADSGEAGKLVKTLLAQLKSDDPTLRADKAALEKVQLAHQQRAEGYFAKVAQSWDVLRKLHVPESAVEAAILHAAGTQKVNRLLDLGTGTGRMLELLANKYNHGTGVDSSREMIAVARAKLSAAAISHAQVRLGDILQLEANEYPADLIVLHQVLHYFDDPARVIVEAERVLVKEGRILIVDFAPHEMEFLRERDAHRRLGLSQSQMQDWARAAGLKVDLFEEFTNQNAKVGLVVCLWQLSKTDDLELS